MYITESASNGSGCLGNFKTNNTSSADVATNHLHQERGLLCTSQVKMDFPFSVTGFCVDRISQRHVIQVHRLGVELMAV